MPERPGTSSRPVHRRAWFVLGAVIAGSLLLSVSAAALICRIYWGFAFSPPAMDRRLAGATAVLSFSSTGYDSKLDRLVHYEDYAGPPAVPRELDRKYVEEPYYLPMVRVLSLLERRAVLSGPVPPVDDKVLSTVLGLVRDSGHVVPDSGSPHHLTSSRMGADVMEILGPEKEPLLIVLLHAGEVSNDHLPFYEFVFDRVPSPPRFLSVRQWYFDVAGVEGMTFPRLATAISILLLLVTIPPTAATLAYRRFSKAGRISRGLCPQCGYDLCADFSKGCPECAWGVGDSRTGERDTRQYRLAARLARSACRPPGRRLATLCGIGVFLVWVAASMPGGHPTTLVFGHWFCYTTAAILVMKAVGPFHPSARRENGRRYPKLRIASVAAVLILTWVGESERWPLSLRFGLSRRALESHVLAHAPALAGPAQREQIVGLYWCGPVVATTDNGGGTIVWVGDAGGHPHMRAFVWYPAGVPEGPQAYHHPIALEPLGVNWYLWDYVVGN